MLVDDIREQIKAIRPDLDTVTQCWEQAHFEATYQRLHALSTQENFWQNADQTKILKDLQAVKTLRDRYLQVTNTYHELAEMTELFHDDEAQLRGINAEIQRCISEIKRLKVNLLLSGEDDDANCFLSINSGAGVSTVLSPGTSPLPSVVRRAGTLIGISLMSAVFAPGHTPQYPFFAGLSMYVTAECLARMYSTLHAPKLTWSVASKGYSVANGVWALIQRVYATVFVNGTTMTKAGWPHGPSGQQKVLNALLLPCSIALGVHLFGADGFKNVPEVLREHLLQLRKK